MRVTGKSFARKSLARLRGIALALIGVAVLAFAIVATTHQHASAATERSASAVIDEAFATLRATAPHETGTAPQAMPLDCSDFATAFINATCDKTWRKHASVRRRRVTAVKTAMIANKR